MCARSIAGLLILSALPPLAAGAAEGKRDAGGRDAQKAARRGRFLASFAERSPFSLPEAFAKRLRAKHPGDYDLSKERFEVYVPGGYDPATPYGLFVWINSVATGGTHASWRSVFDEHRLIAIGANNSGSERKPEAMRICLALDAVHNMKKSYSVDPGRVYISGSSSGSRIASVLGITHADVFSGAFCIVGCNCWRKIATPGMPGAFWKADFAPPPDVFAVAKENSRYVLLTGDRDFNRGQIKATYDQAYSKDLKYATYLEVPGLAHQNPDAEWFEKGIVALDRPHMEAARRLFRRAVAMEARGRHGAALEGYAEVVARMRGRSIARDAESRAAAIRAKLASDIERAQRAVEEKSYREAVATLRSVVRRFGEAAPGEAVALLERLRADPAVREAIARADEEAALLESEGRAAEALTAARELAAGGGAKAFEALRRVARDHPGTEAARAAAAEADRMITDPELRARAEGAKNAKAAERLLGQARNFAANGMDSKARKMLKEILAKYPGTGAAAEANRLLQKIGDG